MIIIREKDKQSIYNIIAQTFSKPVEIWAYGSRVNGTCHDTSDLDLVIRTKDLSPIQWELVENFNSMLKDSNIPILIEARDWAKLPEYFHRQILRNYEPL